MLHYRAKRYADAAPLLNDVYLAALRNAEHDQAALTDAATTLVMALRELGRDSEADEIEKVVYAL